MHDSITKIVTIMFEDDYGETSYLAGHGRNGAGDLILHWDSDEPEAQDIKDLSVEDQVDLMNGLQEENENFSDFRLVTITKTIEEFSLDDDVYKEAIQNAALKKLSNTEVKALGLLNVFTYIKTKFHNA